MTVTEKIAEGFSDGKLTFKTENEIIKILGLTPKEKGALRTILNKLEKEGIIIKVPSSGYATPEQCGAVRGVIQASNKGFAFLIPDDRETGQKDLFLPKHSLGGALDGDRVLALPVKGTVDEGRVIKILERGCKVITGLFEKTGGAYYVIPDRTKFASRVLIANSLTYGAARGDKVVCEITSYPEGKAPQGKVIEILGDDGDFFVEELAIIRGYGLNKAFPKEVERAAAEAAKQPIVTEGRRDLRGWYTVTIDGEDTRDMDDAVTLKKTENGYILGVHIADVSHYVTRGDVIDKEAYKRGTSVYFPDRVIPMLPRSLSNGACSLNMGEERYTLSCIITLDNNGVKTGAELCESVIVSDAKLTYPEVTKLIEGDREVAQKYPDFVDMAYAMKELCVKLEAQRKARGNIDLALKEAHISINERGEIVIPNAVRTISEKIIEQFMICANEAVAEKMTALKAPFMYRVHERPDPEKMATFTQFIGTFGINAVIDGENCQPEDISAILKQAEGKPYEAAVNKSLLRSLQKARYSDKNYGHFALASECYCHFTSPIRRYPDLFIHRIIKEYLHGEGKKASALYKEGAKEQAAHCSLCEKNADYAERDVDALYKLMYISYKTGEEFEATVSGVTAYGIFAELDNTVEGHVRLDRLPEDSYEYFEDKYTLLGKTHKYTLGDRVKIRVDGCDWDSMRAEFSLVE